MHNSETGLTLLYDRSSPPKDYFLQSDHEHLHVFQHHGKRRTRKTSRPNSSDLSTEIHAKLCKSAFDDQSRDFLPEGAIDSLITEDAIRKKLGVLVDDPINVEIVHFVLKRAKRLFVIAILAGLTSGRRESEDYGQLATAMLDFQFAEMDDSCLPILFDDTRTQRPFYDEDEEIMDPWDPVKIRNFSRDQWTVLVPVLLHNGPMLDLHPNCILPIIEKETVASGGFSEVIRVRIHEQHLLGPITKVADMALKVMKQVYSDDKTEANQLDAVWERELYAYDNLRHHPHPNMIEFIAAIRRGVDRFLLFRWADGGNLRRFWTLNKQPLLNSALVKDVIFQLRGLTGALQQFHNLNYRHGDLKPENILCAFEQAPEAGRLNVPVMKISDLGLARRHFATTQLRDNRTSTNCTTVRYEPPEAELEMYSHAPRSRRYDMWSFGCIILEMIIWLISGNDSLDKFHRDLDRTGEYKSGSALFVTKLRPDGSRTAHIHPHVEDTMEALASSLGGLGNTAVEELLKIVKERLLVVALAGRSRWDSSQLLAALNGMVERGNANPSYWSIQRSLSHEGLLAMPILSEDIVVDLDPPENWKSDKLDVTEHPVDNTFAEEAYRALRASDMSEPIEQPPSRLCVRCRSLDLSNPEFRCLETISGLQREQDVCDFCKLRLQACRKLNIGLTSLPEAGSESHFAILRQWLHDCDDNHPQCQPHTSREGATAPTRLLDVGTAESWTVRLVETNTYESYNYLVLSYCWGIVANLRTLPENYQQHSQGIDIESLPKTIRDAVITTRALKHRYLWVDSLCIIQGPDGDFKEEAGRLEEVYSSAHCVLAASSARDTSIGFLTNRNQPGFVHLPPPTASNAGTSSLYVCDFIDDFDKHALGGNLAQRGWSLQDRALARRTIYLTDVQTYFECGNGVRCETLAKLENKMHSFLGDPHFPSRLSSAVVDGDEKIRYYQHLYRQYSRMHFTFPTDRAVAIAGMEQRMSREMKVKGGYGVFDDGSGGTMLLRSLLWRRAAGQDALKRFTEAPLTQNRRLPTWSWMAYEGAIDYLDPPSESSSLEWIKGAITADWDWDENQCEPLGPPLLSATSHRLRYTLATSRVGGDVEIILDDGESGFDRMAQEWTQCGFVILATRKLPGGGEKMHYVLILAPRIDQGANTKEYERVGVGRVPGRWLSTYHADLVFII
ncbi:HET-domain-containing protein [Cladorrhinum sp. PSN332]|nr:HET-domain-containing protein [Cladorrhinum sp. PSN332]